MIAKLSYPVKHAFHPKLALHPQESFHKDRTTSWHHYWFTDVMCMKDFITHAVVQQEEEPRQNY